MTKKIVFALLIASAFSFSTVSVSEAVTLGVEPGPQRAVPGNQGDVEVYISGPGDLSAPSPGSFDLYISSAGPVSNNGMKAGWTLSVQGDLDGDGNVDWDDLRILLGYRNQPASDCPGCDLDGDGTITSLDSRKMATICTLPRCATE